MIDTEALEFFKKVKEKMGSQTPKGALYFIAKYSGEYEYRKRFTPARKRKIKNSI
jgi:hypothetical protein